MEESRGDGAHVEVWSGEVAHVEVWSGDGAHVEVWSGDGAVLNVICASQGSDGNGRPETNRGNITYITVF